MHAFDLHTSRVYKALTYPIRIIIPVQIIFGLLAAFFLLLFLFPKQSPGVGDLTDQQVLGFLLVLIGFNVWCIMLWVFYDVRLRPFTASVPFADIPDALKRGDAINSADYLDLETARLIRKAVVFARKKNIPLSPIVVLHMFLQSPRTDFLFARLLVRKADFAKGIEVIVDSRHRITMSAEAPFDEFLPMMERALVFAAEHACERISLEHIIATIVAEDKTIQKLFFDFGVKKDDVAHVVAWQEHYFREREPKPFLDTFRNIKGIADDWVYGYTPTLDIYARSVTVSSIESEEHLHILAHDEQIDRVETTLARSGKNNIVLVGEAGVGKKSVVQGFAQRLLYGTTLPPLTHKRVMALDVNLVIARSRDNAAALALLDTILSECRNAGNIVLVLDNIQNVIGPQRKENISGIDISGVIIPYLESDLFQMIALTDHAAYHTHIEAVPALSVLFEKVEIPEPDEERTLLILEDMTPKIERRSNVFISYYALHEAVDVASSFIQNVPFPEKAITLLDEVISFVKAHRLFGNVVTQDHVTEVISKKTGVPLGRIEGEEKAKLLNMESLLHQRIIGQNESIVQVASALRRVRAGVTERKRPIGTFLFLGPTGVGKTETAKALADIYFGSETRMIRLDMTEYQDAASMHRLIGNADTETKAQFADKIREQPFSLVLLDELEKSHPNIMNLFLQILDEGHLTDAFQKSVSFRNTMIIATSNAGSEFIREYVKTGQNMAVIQEKLIAYLLKNHIFTPEFLNRFDATIVFQPLKRSEVKEIAVLLLNAFRAHLEKKGYVFQINDELIDFVAEKGFDPDFGARELRRFVQEKIENTIAQKIIKGEYKEGDTISLTAVDLV